MSDSLQADPEISRQATPFDFVIAGAACFFCCAVTFTASSWGTPNLSEWAVWSTFARSQLWLDLIACAAAAPIAWMCSRVGLFTFPASIVVGSTIGFCFGAIVGWMYYAIALLFAPFYGASASTIFFVTLTLQRPTALPKQWRNRTIVGVLLMCATPILIMLFINWLRAVGLTFRVAP